MTGPAAPPAPPSWPPADGPAHEDRLRRGLREAADALPADDLAYGFVVGPDGGGPGGPSRRVVRRPGFGPGHRRRAPVADRRAVALAAAAALVAGALGFAARWATEPSPDGGEAGEPATPEDGTLGRIGDGITRDPSGDGTNLGALQNVTGRAVVVGRSLLTSNAEGQTIGRRSLAPLESVVAIASDTEGGWVACGPDRPAPVWYPANAVPVELDRPVACEADALSVTRTLDGPALVYEEPHTGDGGRLGTRLLDADRPAVGDAGLGIAGLATDGWGAWSASWDEVVAETPDGLRMYTLDGEEREVGIEVDGDMATLRAAMAFTPSPEDATFSPAVAAVVAAPGATEVRPAAEVVVWDLASGVVLWSDAVAAPAEDVALSFDGVTVAFAVPGESPVAVDLDTGERRTFGPLASNAPVLLP